MSIKSFDELLQNIYSEIKGRDTQFRDCISPEEKLLVTLRYLASGCYFIEFTRHYRLGMTTVRTIVRQVCTAIWNQLKERCRLPEPTAEQWIEIANGFKNRAQFPNCIGAVDGKHVRIEQPPHSGSLYYNYKRYFSIVLMAICDSDYKFISIDVGAYGKCGDSSVFKDSAFYEKLMNGQLKIPGKSPISSNDLTPMPHVFVGDEAFPLTDNIMRPFPGNNLNPSKKIFNYRLTRARRYIECSFGILANKWRILHRSLNVDIDFAVDIVKTCCIVHNFVRDRDGIQFEDTLTTFPVMEEELPHDRSRNTRRSAGYRERFMQYFVGEGQIPCQNKYV